ncbi:MAG: EamA family transporter [Metallosphaera sp.]
MGPIKASTFVLLVPVSSYFFSYLILNEVPTISEVVGSAVTLLGVFLTFLPGVLIKKA